MASRQLCSFLFWNLWLLLLKSLFVTAKLPSQYHTNAPKNKSHPSNIETSLGLRWQNVSLQLRQPSLSWVPWSRWRTRKRLSNTNAGVYANSLEETYLLEPCSGFVPNGQLCGIIGPSGAGKSTLLTCLSQAACCRNMGGSVWLQSKSNLGDYDVELLKSIPSMSDGDIAFLKQEDEFFSQLTSRETLNLAAFLQLDLKRDAREKLVTETLNALGLYHVAARQIGEQGAFQTNRRIKGGRLSGGERRRLSVALELLSDIKVLLADEPTTGLDSSQALKVVKLLKSTARDRNIPCLLTMHQPRATIWKALDLVLILGPRGSVVYMGQRSESVAYFTNLGYKCPPETNAAEYFMDLVTIDTEDLEQALLDDKERIDFLVKAFREHKHSLEAKGINCDESPPNVKLQPKKKRSSHPPFLARFGALLRRSLRQNLRDVKVNVLRGSASIVLAHLFSELFKSVKHGMPLAKGVADRTALLSFGVINMTMLALMKSLNLFGKEKKVVNREKMKRQYTSIEYLLSKCLAELPLDATFSVLFASALKQFTFLNTTFGKLCSTFALMTVAGASLGYAVGSMTTGVEEAMTLGMPIMVIFMAVGVINPSGVDPKAKIPWIVQCLKRLSPVGIAIEALCIAEYKGLDFGSQGKRFRVADLPRMGGLALVRNGDQVLGALGLSGQTYSSKMLDLGKLSGVFLLTSLVGLKLSEPNRPAENFSSSPSSLL